MNTSPYTLPTIWSRAIILAICLGLSAVWADVNLDDFEWTSSSVTTLSSQGGGDYSGAAYVADRNSIFIADNKQNALFEYNATTFAFKKKINISLGLADLEGVDWMYGNRFVLSDEGLNQLVVVNITATDASITSSDEIYRLSPPISPASNKGLEGVTYDPYSAQSTVDAFFMVQEKPPTLYSINQGGGMSTMSLSAHMTDAAGVSVSPDGNSILVVGEENKKLFRFNRNGVKLQERSIANFNQPEGVDLSGDGTKLFIVGESREVSMIEAPPPVVINPSVSIQKTVMLGSNGSQSCPGSEAVSGTFGTAATYCYAVVNTGDTTLANLSINDAGVNINLPNLAAGASTTAVRSFLILGNSSTSATFTGTPVDASGITYPNQANVSDADGATVTLQVINQPSPSISIAKTVVLSNTAACPGSEQVTGPAGASLTYCYAIANTGDTVLQNVMITDTATSPSISINVGTIGIGGAAMQSASASIQGSMNVAATVTATPVTASGSLPAVSDQDPAEVIQTVVNGGGNNGGGGPVTESWSGAISSGLNDAEYNVYGPNLGSYDLDLGQKDVAVRFENVAIPAGATITSATVVFTARRSRSSTTRTLISGINILPAVDFVQAGSGLDGSALTGANLNWTTQNWTAGDKINTPDLSALVQELVDTASWTEGYAMAFHFFGISGKQEAFSYERSQSRVARLEIDYTLAEDPGNGNGNSNGGGGGGETPDLPVVLADFQGASDTLEQIVTEGVNDAEFRNYMIVGSLDLDLGQKDVGVRFPNLDIPAGARVTGGNIEFIARRTLSIPTTVSIGISNAEDARPFNEAANALNGGETLSGANVHWSLGAWSAGQTYPTPDLRNVIASQIHSDTWAAGQHLSFAIDGQSGKREARTFEESSADAPGLRVTYVHPPVLRHATLSSGGIGFSTWQEDGVVAFHLVANDTVIGSVGAGDDSYSIAAPVNGEFVDLDVEYADRFERITLRRAAPQTGGTLGVYYHTGGGEFITANGANLLTGYTRPPLVLDISDPAAPVVIVGETIMNGTEFGVYFSVESGRTIRVTE